ncbi:hypothetical protein GQ53DRAFT_742590 [Thozetella sp. PMI_491]|nr:hypothetical protein GQ53DRAFT_742590 [Thozetella sp. PMI_491]
MASASAYPSFSVSTLPTTVASDVDQRDDMLTIQSTNIEDLFEAVKQVQGDILIVQTIVIIMIRAHL